MSRVVLLVGRFLFGRVHPNSGWHPGGLQEAFLDASWRGEECDVEGVSELREGGYATLVNTLPAS